MEVTPYNTGDSKTEQVREMFDAIAPKYDLLNHLLSLNIDRGWRRKLVKMVAGQSPRNVLDVATGTGDLAIMLAEKLKESKITGADLSPEMLAVGRAKVKKRGLEIDMTVADVEKLPFGDGEFEAVTAAFGVRNFEHLDRGLREMSRVLTDHGRIYIIEFSKPRKSLFAAVFNLYFKAILPAVGRMISKDARAYTYLPESVGAFPSGENFIRLMHQNGFKNGKARALTFGVATIYSAEK